MGRMWIWAILGVLAAFPAWSVEVDDVRLWRAPDHTRIVFDLSGPAEHKLIVLENPSRIVLDVEDASNKANIANLKLEGTPVQLIRTGIRQGDEVSIFYDPMITKVLAWGESREQALHRLSGALADYHIGGLPTNLPLLRRLLRHPAMAGAALDTGFIGHHAAELLTTAHHPAWLPLAALYLRLARQQAVPGAPPDRDPCSPWRRADGWRVNQPHRETVRLRCDGVEYALCLASDDTMAAGTVQVHVDGRAFHCRGTLTGNALQAELDGHRLRALCEPRPGGYSLLIEGIGTTDFAVCEPDVGAADAGARWGQLAAPMNGRVISLLVSEGATVDVGQALLVIEAMKMEHTLRAPRHGIVKRLSCREGDLVDDGAQLLELAEAGEE